MNELVQDAIKAAQRAAVGDDSSVRDYFERLVSDPGELQASEDKERAYLAVLLDSIGLHDESTRVLRDTADPGPASVNAALRNVEGMLAAVHGQYEQAKGLLREALSAAGDSERLRSKILANLAAVSLQAGSVDEAEEWVAASCAVADSRNHTADVLMASVRAGIALERGDMPGLRDAGSSLREASRSRVAELGTEHPQALVTVANMATTEFILARAEGSRARIERAAAVLEIAASRLAAELGAGHPQALTALESLVLAELDLARADGSVQRMEQATTALAAVSRRIGSVLGDGHPEVQILTENLATARRELSLAQGSVRRPGQTQTRVEPERRPPGVAKQDDPDLTQGLRSLRQALFKPFLSAGPLLFATISHLAVILAAILLYPAYLALVVPAAAIVACAVYTLAIPAAYFVALWGVLISRPAWPPSPERVSKIPASAEPAVLQYFYGPALADANQVVLITYEKCRQLWKSGARAGAGTMFPPNVAAWFTGPFRVAAAIGMALGTIAGALITTVISFIHLLVVGISVTLVRMTGTVLRGVITAILWVKNARVVCPSCFEFVPYPDYICPDTGCALLHRDVRPGRYGVLKRRCHCGTRMNTLLLFGSSHLTAFCPGCGCSLEHRPGEAPEIVLPFLGAAGAGKTRLLSSMVTQLHVWTGQGQLTAEYGDSVTARKLENATEVLRAGIPTFRTPNMLPRAHVIRLTVKKRTRVLHMFDASGELFYSTERTQELRYLNKARTFIFVIDPLSIEAFWRQSPAATQAELSSMRSAAPPPELTYEQTLLAMGDMGVRPKKARLAVVFSRADLISMPGQEVAEWASSELGLGNLIRSTTLTFKEVRFFRTAAVTDPDGNVDKSVAELMHWVLDRDGINLSAAMP